MTKKIQGKTKSGQSLWIIAPSVVVKSYSGKDNFTNIDIFYFFAQFLIKPRSKKLTEGEKKQTIVAKKRMLIELDNKVVKLKFFARELKKQEKKLLQRKDDKKKVYDYKPYQIFIGLAEAYFNTVHSIHDLIKKIDKSIGKKFSKKIWKEDWFKLNMDLRNLFHHIESPLCTVEKRQIIFTFERIDELDQPPKFFTAKMKDRNGRLQVVLESHDLGENLLIFLERWAKKYLELLDGEEEMSLITGFKKDGSFRSKKVKLKELMKGEYIA